jgi:hypothetical protein
MDAINNASLKPTSGLEVLYRYHGQYLIYGTHREALCFVSAYTTVQSWATQMTKLELTQSTTNIGFVSLLYVYKGPHTVLFSAIDTVAELHIVSVLHKCVTCVDLSIFHVTGLFNSTAGKTRVHFSNDISNYGHDRALPTRNIHKMGLYTHYKE